MNLIEEAKEVGYIARSTPKGPELIDAIKALKKEKNAVILAHYYVDGEIQEFCKARFGVTFPLASKVSVNGDDTAPIYKWLTNKAQNGVLDATISWNFNKFLLDENGKMIAYYPSSVTPDSEEITKHLK